MLASTPDSHYKVWVFSEILPFGYHCVHWKYLNGLSTPIESCIICVASIYSYPISNKVAQRYSNLPVTKSQYRPLDDRTIDDDVVLMQSYVSTGWRSCTHRDFHFSPYAINHVLVRIHCEQFLILKIWREYLWSVQNLLDTRTFLIFFPPKISWIWYQ